MTNPAPTPDDEFAAAFSELSVPHPAKPANEAPATAAATPATPETPASSPETSAAPAKPAPDAASAPTDGTSAAGPGESTTSGDAATATSADTAAASSDTAAQPAETPSETPAAPAGYVSQDQFAALQAELAALKKQSAAPAEQPRTEQPRAEPPPLYTADEQAVIEGYLKEWPDVAKGEALMRRAEYSQLVKYVFDQFAPRLDALESSQTSVSTRTQYQDIVSLVPDYDTVRDATLAWIDTQPGYLKSAYQKVAEEGSPQDVADLITRFKKETGYVAGRTGTSATPATPAAAAPAGTGATAAPTGSAQAAGAQGAAASAGAVSASLPAAAQAAAAALKPVKTTRSEPVSSPDPNDFDAAFKEFASAN